MTRITIPVVVIEYQEGGNTLWVQGPNGGTVLRIKVTGRITSDCCDPANRESHADAIISGSLKFCLANDVERMED